MKINKRNTELGITLVGLVVTIIVLLILAGVSINLVLGNNGVLKQSENAVVKNREGTAQEDIAMAWTSCEADYWTAWSNDTSKTKVEYFTEALGNYTNSGDVTDFNYVEGGTSSGTYISKDGNVSKGFTVDASGNVELTAVPASDYGAEVTNYTPNNNSSVKWKIFFADSDNVYLIADDYIPYKEAPESENNTLYINDNEDNPSQAYCLSMDNVYEDYTGSADIVGNSLLNSKLSRYHKWVYKNQDSKNINMRAIAFILDTDIWTEKFGNSTYAEYAIGGPTLEMFCESYNATHSTPIEYNTDYEYGYKIRLGSTENYANWFSGLDVNERLYVIKDTDKAYAMWLASPSADDYSNLLYMGYGGDVGDSSYNLSTPGFRPLVCLKSSVQLEKVVTDGVTTYTLK